MFRKVNFRLFLWLVCFGAVLGIGITGCGGHEEDDENGAAHGGDGGNEWIVPGAGYGVTRWRLESINGKNRYLDKAAYLDPEVEDILLDRGSVAALDKNQFGPIVLVRTWELVFYGDGTMEASIAHYDGNGENPRAHMRDQEGTYSLSGTRFTINVFVSHDYRFNVPVGYDKGVEQTITGTWSREGEWLTLRRDDGPIAVYELLDYYGLNAANNANDWILRPGEDSKGWTLRSLDGKRSGTDDAFYDPEIEDILLDRESVAALENKYIALGGREGEQIVFVRTNNLRFYSDGTIRWLIDVFGRGGRKWDGINGEWVDTPYGKIGNITRREGTYSLSGTRFTFNVSVGGTVTVEQTITGTWFSTGDRLKMKRDDGRTAKFSRDF